MKKLRRKLMKAMKSFTVWFSATAIPASLYGLQYASENIDLIRDNLGTSYGVVAFALPLMVSILRVRSTK